MKATPLPSPDFQLVPRGVSVLLSPLTPRAERWLYEHIAHVNDVLWSAGALVVEAPSVAPLVAGIRRDGLEVA